MAKKRVPLGGSVRSAVSHLGEGRAREAKPRFKSVAGEQVVVSLALRHPNAGKLASLDDLAAVAPSERRLLSEDAFHQASEADLAVVRRFAKEYGLSVEHEDAQGRVVRLGGSATAVGEAFGVHLVHCRVEDGPDFRAHFEEISLPENLHEVVVAVLGLDTFPKVFRQARVTAKSESTPTGQGGKPQTRNPNPPAYYPPEVAEFYSYPKEYDGSGECIGIIALGGGYSLEVLKSYFDFLHIPLPSISWVNAGADNNYQLDGSAEEALDTNEVMLDCETAGTTAPGAKIVVYFGDNDWVEPFQKAIGDTENRPSVLTCSFASPEVLMTTQEKAALDLAFTEAANKGITILVASGDTGSSISSVNAALGFIDNLPMTNYPTGSPGVLGVGGTVYTRTGPKKSDFDETTWNWSGDLLQEQVGLKKPPESVGATGGGQSLVWALPAWQQAANVSTACSERFVWEPPKVQASLHSPFKIPSFGRGVPDVGAHAAAYTMLVEGTAPENLGLIMGTSASTPLWAALIARINQALRVAKGCDEGSEKGRVGFLNPTLYNHLEPGALRLISTGSNGAYAARPDWAWNACTGLGAPNGSELLKQLLRIYNP